MKKFVILTDSGSDLGKEIREQNDIKYIKMLLQKEGEEFPVDLDWTVFSPLEFYDSMRDGALYRTTQVTVEMYEKRFEEIIKSGKDVLSLTMSSGLSGSINASHLARKSVLEKYPDAVIECVDTLRGSLGQGLMVCHAAKMRDEGKSIGEIAKWVEDNRLNVHQVGSVETLLYLKRAGRVTGPAAFMCKLLNIKPIIISDVKGQNKTVGKVRGRNASIKECLRIVKETIVNPEEQTVFFVHTDCFGDEAQSIKKMILDEIKCKDVYVNYVGPVIGATVGPGMFGIYYLGTKVAE